MNPEPVQIKEGVPPRHYCSSKLPSRARPGAVWQCTCGKYYRYGEYSDLYGDEWNEDPLTPAKQKHSDYKWEGRDWRECDKSGRPLYRQKVGKKKIGWFRSETIYEWWYSDE